MPDPTTPTRPPIRACLFDMDGLLLNTEDLIILSRDNLLKSYNLPPLPWKLKAQLQGRSKSSSDEIFLQSSGLADLGVTREEYEQKFGDWKEILFPECGFLPGAEVLVRGLEGKVELGLCTSSAKREFEIKTKKFGEFFDRYFPARENGRRVLGDDLRIPEGEHKPAPDVWIVALEAVNVETRRGIRAEECLVFEDSILGVLSARRAGMRVCWCPHEGLVEVVRREGWGSGCLPEGEFGEEILRLVDGEEGDGWLRLVGSLEEFRGKEYGISMKEG